MTQANKYRLSGTLFALFCFVIFGGNSIFSKVIAGLRIATLPRELRLGIDTGLISLSDCNRRYLNSACRTETFNQKLGIMLEQIGALEDTDADNLAKAGIINSFSGRISRKATVETLARTTIFLAHKRLIKLPLEDATTYRDYRIPAKYSQAIKYMQQKFVVRGYSNRSLGAGKNLTNREAIFFIYRLYESVAAEMMSKHNSEGIRFVDIPLSHPIMNSIDMLTQVGAFDKVMLKPAFDGDSNITKQELNDIIEGIFERNNLELDEIRIKTIFAEETSPVVNRKQLAMILEYLLSFSNTTSSYTRSLSYNDISMDSAEYQTLKNLAKAGIKLGYNNGLFKGSEKVTWFETIKTIAEIMKNFRGGNKQANVEPDRLATRDDILRFTDILKAKQARIRSILNRKRPYKR
jgi:hypothetical protein